MQARRPGENADLERTAVHNAGMYGACRQLTENLQAALEGRAIIEQAKGVLSAHAGVDMQQAFAALRGYARARNLRLSDLARTVAEGTADLNAILHRTPVPPPAGRNHR